MSVASIETLNRLLKCSSENEIVEFKEAKNNYDFNKLGKYFSALSNEANLGRASSAWLVFGVKDNLTIIGTHFRLVPKDLESLKQEVAEKTTNRITFIAIHSVDHPQGSVLLFEIPAAPQGLPIAWEGHYYGRDGESLGPLNLAEIERIRNQNSLLDWSSGIIAGAAFADLDPVAISLAREKFCKKNPNLATACKNWEDVTFLNKAKITINGSITRTAILLLGKPESSHWLNPASATITWILKDRDGLERDYQHFSCPLLTSVDEVFSRIRNLKYRYLAEGTLFPEEVDQYDPYIIREALNNAIAHQDYELGGKVTLVEYEDGRLCFDNMGTFIPGTIESVIRADAPESRYRNRFLADAMVNLSMIDTIGSGIRKMFLIQKSRFFPLPEYVLNDNRVQVTITGRVIDIAYARKLAQMPTLSLEDIILLDRVQKRLPLTTEQSTRLKQQELIEGRKPNFHISARVASHSGTQVDYVRSRGLNDQHYKSLICDYLQQFGSAKRSDINHLLLDKLPEVLDESQRGHKIKNLLQLLKKEGRITAEGKNWRMSNPTE